MHAARIPIVLHGRSVRVSEGPPWPFAIDFLPRLKTGTSIEWRPVTGRGGEEDPHVTAACQKHGRRTPEFPPLPGSCVLDTRGKGLDARGKGLDTRRKGLDARRRAGRTRATRPPRTFNTPTSAPTNLAPHTGHFQAAKPLMPQCQRTPHSKPENAATPLFHPVANGADRGFSGVAWRRKLERCVGGYSM